VRPTAKLAERHSEVSAEPVRPLARTRGVPRFRRSTGPAHALRAPLLTL